MTGPTALRSPESVADAALSRASAPVVRAEGLEKRYGSDVPFEGLDLRIRPGESIRLVGPNGAGKTQLMLGLAGLVTLDRGKITLESAAGGRAVVRSRRLRDRTFRFVPAVVGALGEHSIGECCLLWSRSLRPLSLGSRRKAAKESFERHRRFLEEVVGRDLDPDRPVAQLSIGQQKRLLCAASLSGERMPFVFLMDEPLAGLDREGVEAVCCAIADARERGGAVVIAEHRSEIERLGFDYRIELPFRRSAAVRSAESQATEPGLVFRPTVDADARHVLELREVTAGYPGTEVYCARLEIERGGCVVVRGSNGSGKTGFLRALVRERPTRFAGDVRFDGRATNDLHGPMLTGDVRFMSQHRRNFGDLRAREALMASGFSRRGRIPEAIRKVADQLVPSKRVRDLSSGSQALLCMAQTLASKPRLALLDEPTANVDAANRRRMGELIGYARREWGTGFLFVEHTNFDIPDAVAYSLVRDGRSRMELSLSGPVPEG